MNVDPLQLRLALHSVHILQCVYVCEGELLAFLDIADDLEGGPALSGSDGGVRKA